MNYTLWPYSVSFESVVRTPLSWKEEVLQSARYIAAKTSKPIWLCSNGGLMSEVMCRAFFEQGINVHVLSLRTGSASSTEQSFVIQQWCRIRGIECTVIDLDLADFLTQGIGRYVDDEYASATISPYFRIKLLEIVENFGGYAVLGEGAQHYRVDPLVAAPRMQDVYLEFDVGLVAPLEWCRRNGTSHEPFFFAHTSEVSLAYAINSRVSASLINPHQLQDPAYAHALRRMVAQEAWPEIPFRKKTHFYSDVMPLKQAAEANLEHTFDSDFRSYRLPIELMLKQLRGEALI
jgi:hypothetical protein